MAAYSEASDPAEEEDIRFLCAKLTERGPREACNLLVGYPEGFVERVLEQLNPAARHDLLDAMPRARRELVLAAASPENRRQWLENDRYPEGTVGRLMEPALAVFPPEATVAEAVGRLRLLTSRAIITYLYIADAADRFAGVVVMRDMLLAAADRPLGEIMLANIFALRPDQTLVEAMRETVLRHYPVYPVVDAGQRIIGLVRGQMLFEAQTVELSAQAGAMVGVREEERLTTAWTRSLRSRQPWLQLNLGTAFLAAAVVGWFGGTVARNILLAAFLPVVISQCTGVGQQSLAITLRGLTLGDLHTGRAGSVARKELWLGLLNGLLTGLVAGLAMYLAARWVGAPDAPRLAAVVVLALTAACVVAGLAGALIPVGLKKFGFDPAKASSILLTAVTDFVAVAALLGLAASLLAR